MHQYMWRFAIALAASAASLSASAQPAAPTAITAKAGKPWLHKATGIALPATIDGFARGEILDLSDGPQLDVSIAYDDPIGRTHVNIYIYHAADPSTALWFDVAATMIATNDKLGTITPHSAPIPFAIPGASVPAGLRQSFAITKVSRSSGVALIGLGEWVVKLRMTSPVYDSAQLDGAMDRMMQQVGWPKKLPPLATATPLAPCAQPRSFGPPAEKAPQSNDIVIANALLPTIDRTLQDKARQSGEAPAALTFCIHPDRISGRLPIYQNEKVEGGYMIPLGDSGELLTVGKPSLTGIFNEKDGVKPWLLSVQKLDRWLQYPSYTNPPPPQQALQTVRTENILSSTSIYGKGNTQISVAPETKTQP